MKREVPVDLVPVSFFFFSPNILKLKLHDMSEGEVI